MKKFLIISLLLILAFTLIACNKISSTILLDNISYLESTKLIGENADYNICLTVGIREQTPITDGIVSPTTPFCTLVVIPKKLGAIEQKISFKLGDKQGLLVRDTARHQLVAQIDNFETADNVILAIDKTITTISLTSLSLNKLTYKQAINIAQTELMDIIKDNLSKKHFNREVCVKMIEDNIGDNGFFYYVGLIGSNEKYNAVLIDATDGSIVARR